MHFSFRTVLKLIGAFFASLLLFILVFLVCTRASLFNSSLYLNNMEKSSYYENVYYTLSNDFSSLSIPAGIPVKVFTDAVSKNRVASDVHSYFKSNFDGKSYEIDLASVQQDLYSAFAKYSKSKGISVDSDTETQKSLLELSTIATQTYRDNVEFPFLKELSSVKKTYDKYLFVAAGSLFLLIVIICFLIWRFERWKHRAIRYYSYAFLGCSLSGIFLFSFALIVRPYKSIGIEPKFLSALISSSLTSYLLTVLITFIVVGILTIEFYPIYKKLFKQVS